MDAANIDLKGFYGELLQDPLTAALRPVLETLEYVKHETRCWLEITTLLIPGKNDSAAEIESLSRWIRERLGPDVPLRAACYAGVECEGATGYFFH